MVTERFVLISGCSGGGKSTLLAELHQRGHAVVEEPGRRIVHQEQAGDGAALPWVDMVAFARCAIEMALADRKAAIATKGWVFFDRGLVDAAAALQHAVGEPVLEALCRAHPYHRCVFMAPPWPEIYETDPERQHRLSAAIDEYERLCVAYALLGYDVMTLPKVSVKDRADHILEVLRR
ncbi:MAG: AAA family ATPase [Sphingobium sp.]